MPNEPLTKIDEASGCFPAEREPRIFSTFNPRGAARSNAPASKEFAFTTSASRLHWLRAGSGHSLHLIGGLLGHRTAITAKRYALLADDPLRNASEVIGARFAAALEARLDAPVFPMWHGAAAVGS